MKKELMIHVSEKSKANKTINLSYDVLDKRSGELVLTMQ